MAQSALGSFAAPFQPTQEAINPLQALIQGFQLPQQIQDQALAQQLNNALMKQKLADLLNPNAALAREVAKQVAIKGFENPGMGVISSPIPGMPEAIVGNPGAITEAQQATLGSPIPGTPNPSGFVQPTAPAGAPITPFMLNGIPLGLSQDPQAAAKAQKDALTQEFAKQQGLSDIIKGRMIDVEKEKSGNKKTALVFKDVGDSIVASDPFTGAEVSRTKKDPKAVYQNRVNGLFVIKDPSKPEEATLVPGTEPVGLSGDAVPVYNPNGSGEILGYQFPKGFKSNKELGTGGTTEAPSKQLLNDLSDTALATIAELKPRISNTTVGVGSYLSNIRGTNASGFDARVKSLASDIRLGVLAQMKSLSKNGSSGLGQLSNQEGKSLESALGSLETSQNPKDFTDSINKVEASIKRWNSGIEKFGLPTPSGAPTVIPSFNSDAEAAAANLPNGTPIIVNGVQGTWQH